MSLNASVPTFIVPDVAKKYPVVNDEQPLNALAPMLVTDAGMVTIARRVQLRNDDGPMAATVAAIV